MCVATLLLPWLYFLFSVMGALLAESLLVYDRQSLLDFQHNGGGSGAPVHGWEKTLSLLLAEIPADLYS